MWALPGALGRRGSATALAHLAPTLGKRCPEVERAEREAQLARSTAWMDTALAESSREALTTGWILELRCHRQAAVRPSGRRGSRLQPDQAGATEPYTYWIANVRLVLAAEVQDGKAHAAKHSLPRLLQVLASLPPTSVRVWCAATTPSAMNRSWHRWKRSGKTISSSYVKRRASNA